MAGRLTRSARRLNLPYHRRPWVHARVPISHVPREPLLPEFEPGPSRNMSTRTKVCGVYVEPRSYSFSPTPTEAEIFDLSEAIHGIHPLPGFGVLSEPEDEDSVLFVPFLGFEGHRLAYVLEQVQPPGRKIFPA